MRRRNCFSLGQFWRVFYQNYPSNSRVYVLHFSITFSDLEKYKICNQAATNTAVKRQTERRQEKTTHVTLSPRMLMMFKVTCHKTCFISVKNYEIIGSNSQNGCYFEKIIALPEKSKKENSSKTSLLNTDRCGYLYMCASLFIE